MSEHKDFNRQQDMLEGRVLDLVLNHVIRREVVETPPLSFSENKADIKMPGTDKKNLFL